MFPVLDRKGEPFINQIAQEPLALLDVDLNHGSGFTRLRPQTWYAYSLWASNGRLASRALLGRLGGRIILGGTVATRPS
jgi:hypothetical protein